MSDHPEADENLATDDFSSTFLLVRTHIKSIREIPSPSQATEIPNTGSLSSRLVMESRRSIYCPSLPETSIT
jgi:hypothetical protein